MTDSSGTVVWSVDYKPYNYMRDYNPMIGRYIESDPMGIKRGENHLYAYVAGNPIMHVDPNGLAYFAKRPLHGFPWMGRFSCKPGSIDDIDNTEISHEQIFFDDGKSPSNVGFFDDGTLKMEPNPTGYHCRSGNYNDCIMRKAVQNVPLRTYCLLGKLVPLKSLTAKTGQMR